MDFYQCLRDPESPQPWHGSYYHDNTKSVGQPSLRRVMREHGHRNLRFLAKKEYKSKIVFCIACARNGVEHSLKLATYKTKEWGLSANKQAMWASWEASEGIMLWSCERPTKERPASAYVPWGDTDYIKSLGFATAGELKTRGFRLPLIPAEGGATVSHPRLIPHLDCVPGNAASKHGDTQVGPSKTSFESSMGTPSSGKRSRNYDTPPEDAQETYKRPKYEESATLRPADDVTGAFQSAAFRLHISNSRCSELTTESTAPNTQSEERLDSTSYRPSMSLASTPAPSSEGQYFVEPQTDRHARCETGSPGEDYTPIPQGDEHLQQMNNHRSTQLPTPSDLYGSSPRAESGRPGNHGVNCAGASLHNVAAAGDETLLDTIPASLNGCESRRGLSAGLFDLPAGDTETQSTQSRPPEIGLADRHAASPPYGNVATEFRRLQLRRKILLGKEDLDESLPKNKIRLGRRLNILQIEQRLDELSAVVNLEDNNTTEIRRLERRRNMLLIEEELDDSAPRDRKRREREVKILEIVYELDLLGVVVDS